MTASVPPHMRSTVGAEIYGPSCAAADGAAGLRPRGGALRSFVVTSDRLCNAPIAALAISPLLLGPKLMQEAIEVAASGEGQGSNAGHRT
jgi:hypothetical protein